METGVTDSYARFVEHRLLVIAMETTDLFVVGHRSHFLMVAGEMFILEWYSVERRLPVVAMETMNLGHRTSDIGVRFLIIAGTTCYS